MIAGEFNSADGTARKLYYGKDGEQPWDVIVRAGWGARFAAANVLKYLRRTKAVEDVDKARWYWARLRELATPRRGVGRTYVDGLVLSELVSLLTEAELATLRETNGR